MLFFFFNQKTAYEMRISDWSSDVCSSDLVGLKLAHRVKIAAAMGVGDTLRRPGAARGKAQAGRRVFVEIAPRTIARRGEDERRFRRKHRSEEHTSELQSLMRISYAVFCLTKKNQ